MTASAVGVLKTLGRERFAAEGPMRNAQTRRRFTPPTAQDWVLVLDNAALNLPAPGQ